MKQGTMIFRIIRRLPRIGSKRTITLWRVTTRKIRGIRVNKRNHFPSDMTFQTFLLDKNNKVAVIGNPIHNLAVKELYIKHISGQISSASSSGQTRTTVTPDVSDIDMGKANLF